jgi:hypothetical protein
MKTGALEFSVGYCVVEEQCGTREGMEVNFLIELELLEVSIVGRTRTGTPRCSA